MAARVESHPTNTDAPFSPHRAFVVQFRARCHGEPQYLTGRAEHVTSGQATRFYSLEELSAFIERILTDAFEQPP